MLIITNRELDAAPDASAFSRRFTPGATRLGMATATRLAPDGWQVGGAVPDAGDDTLLHALVPIFQGARPVLVYLHGFNNPPADALARCELLGRLYGTEVIGFSWPSEGCLSDGSELPRLTDRPVDETDQLARLRPDNVGSASFQSLKQRYLQAKVNAQVSVDALARFLRLIGTARLYAGHQPYTLAAHSLGVHYLQYTLDLPGCGESLGTAQNLALLAACARASGHRDWVEKLRAKGQVFLTYNAADWVLYGAFVADGSQAKLGADPGPDRVLSPTVRYISFNHGPVGLGTGHHYFALDPMPAASLKLFGRIFRSERDLQAGEAARDVYLVGCDENGQTCYMGRPDLPYLPG